MKPKVQPLGAAIARERRDGGQVKLSTFIPLKIRKRGASKVVVRPDGAVESPGKVANQIDQPLLVALTRAFYWQQLLDDGVVGSGSEIAQREGQRAAASDAAGAGHHPEHPGRAAAQVHEPAVVPAQSAADRLGGAAGGGGGVRRLTELRALDDPCHITAAFGALAHQQQVATLDVCR